MVQGVALELLCRLLFTEGSNPSLSALSPNSLHVTDCNISNQITMDTFILTVRSFFHIDFLFLIVVVVVPKILQRKGWTRNENIPLYYTCRSIYDT